MPSEKNKTPALLRRPLEQLPKEYKNYINQEYPRLLNQMQHRESIRMSRGDIPKLFLLDDRHVNLPDMDQEELKLVFPYYFDWLLRTGAHLEEFSAEKLRKIHDLSQTKRIPLILGMEYELQEFAPFFSRKEKLKEGLQGLLDLTDPAVLESHMTLILQMGVFPGIRAEELKEMGIRSLQLLMGSWKYYSDIKRHLENRMRWYTGDESTKKRWEKNFYAGDRIEVEWELLEFLQVRLVEWERRVPLSAEEQAAMEVLAHFVKTKACDRETAAGIAFLFDGDTGRAEKFLEENQKHTTSLVFDKHTLEQVYRLACRTVLDQEENGRRLKQFMEQEAHGLELIKAGEEDRFRFGWNMPKISEIKFQDTAVSMKLEAVDGETFRLLQLTMDGMQGIRKLVFDRIEEEYHPVLRCQDIWTGGKLQRYSRLIIEGEERIALTIPKIISIEKDAFRELPIEELEICSVVETIAAGAFRGCQTLRSVKISGGVKLIEEKAFADCTHLKEVLLTDSVMFLGSGCFCGCTALEEIHIPASVEQMGWGVLEGCTSLKRAVISSEGCMRGLRNQFRGCTQLDSILGPDRVDLLNPGPDMQLEDGVAFQKNILFWEKIQRTGAKKLIWQNMDEESVWEEEDWRDVIYWERPKECCGNQSNPCDSLEEIQVLEGTYQIGNEFRGCSSLRRIILPESLRWIAYSAFDGCEQLTEVALPAEAVVQTYRERWERFDGDLNIFEKLRISEDHCCYTRKESIVYMGKDILWASGELEGRVVIPEGVQRIYERAFAGCDRITELVLPESLEILEYGAFFGCTSLEKVVVLGRHLWVDSREPDPEQLCYWGWNAGPLLFAGRSVFGEQWPKIRTEYPNLPRGVLKIPEGTTAIPFCEYAGCEGLTEVILPRSLKKVGAHAFAGCTGLKRVVLKGMQPWAHAEEVFGENVPELVFPGREESRLKYRPFAGIKELIKGDE